MKRSYFYLAILLLAGCETTPINQLPYDELVKLSNKFEATCQALGLKRNSREYKQCYYQEAVAEQTRRDQNVQRLKKMQEAGKIMQEVGEKMQENNRQARPKTITCQSIRGLGDTIQTNCTQF